MAADFLGAAIVLPGVVRHAIFKYGLAAAVYADEQCPAGEVAGAGPGGLDEVIVRGLRVGTRLRIITPAAG